MSLSLVLVFCLTSSAVVGYLYDVTVDSFEADPNSDKDFVTINSLRVSRKDRKSFILTGSATTHRNCGNENMCVAEIRGRDGRGPVLLSVKQQFCDLYNSDYEIVKSAIEAFNMPPQGTCPLPQGNYTLDGLELQEKDLPLVVMKDRYELSVSVIDPDGKLLLGYKIKVTVS